jgi:hypothetical protein
MLTFGLHSAVVGENTNNGGKEISLALLLVKEAGG